MKAHIGVDAKRGLTHTLVTTPANEHDLNQVSNLLHGEEKLFQVMQVTRVLRNGKSLRRLKWNG